MSQPTQPDDAERLCPQCGYDLRGIASDRCPECGLSIDRSAGRTSRIPWTHRREIGRVRAYAATVWMVMRRPRRLLNDAALPVSYRDARRFRIVTTTLIYPPLLAIMAGVVVAAFSGAIEPKTSVVGNPAAWVLALQWDAAVPTLAGWLFTPVTAVLVGVAAWHLTAVLPWLLHRPSLPMPHRARAVALAHYAAAPAVLLPIGAVTAAGVGLIVFASNEFRWRTIESALLAAAIVAGLTVVVTSIFVWLRAVQFYRVLGRGSAGRWLVGAALLPAAWLAVLAFWLGAVPWATGTCWLLWRGLS